MELERQKKNIWTIDKRKETYSKRPPSNEDIADSSFKLNARRFFLSPSVTWSVCVFVFYSVAMHVFYLWHEKPGAIKWSA